MKKIVCCALAVLLVFALVGCSKQQQGSGNTELDGLLKNYFPDQMYALSFPVILTAGQT
jgi:uncharacterized lipoprotein NlpE involved in copper resistance